MGAGHITHRIVYDLLFARAYKTGTEDLKLDHESATKAANIYAVKNTKKEYNLITTKG